MPVSLNADLSNRTIYTEMVMTLTAIAFVSNIPRAVEEVSVVIDVATVIVAAEVVVAVNGR